MDDEEFLRETLGSMDHVYNIARRMVPRREDAEDLVQETYLAAYRAWVDHRRPRKADSLLELLRRTAELACAGIHVLGLPRWLTPIL